MARRRSKSGPIPATDPVVRGCLNEIRKGRVAGAAVLADRLEELGVPGATRVRWEWDMRLARALLWANTDATRCKRWSRWDAVAAEWGALRREIGLLFGRKWAILAPTYTQHLRRLWDLNEGLVALKEQS